jgi:hypothetical protein
MVMKLEKCEELSDPCRYVSDGTGVIRYLYFEDGIFVQTLDNESHEDMRASLNRPLEEVKVAGKVAFNNGDVYVWAGGSSSMVKSGTVCKGDPDSMIRIFRELPDSQRYTFTHL